MLAETLYEFVGEVDSAAIPIKRDFHPSKRSPRLNIVRAISLSVRSSICHAQSIAAKKQTKISIGGSVSKMEPAITMRYCTDVGLPVILPMTVVSPTGKARVASLLETMKGQTKLFQLVMNVRIANVVRAGPDRGTIIRSKNCNSIAPSIRAESSISKGMDGKTRQLWIPVPMLTKTDISC